MLVPRLYWRVDDGPKERVLSNFIQEGFKLLVFAVGMCLTVAGQQLQSPYQGVGIELRVGSSVLGEVGREQKPTSGMFPPAGFPSSWEWAQGVLASSNWEEAMKCLNWGRGYTGWSLSSLSLARTIAGCHSLSNHFGECSP